MKNLIFALILPVIAFAQNETDLPEVSTPRGTPRQNTPINVHPNNSSQHDTPSTGSSSFFRRVESEYDDGEQEPVNAPLPPPLPFSEHDERFHQLLQNIGNAVNTQGQDVISLIVNINELSFYHGYFRYEAQSQLLRQIATESNSYPRTLAIIRFLNTLFAGNEAILNRINSASFQLQIFQEHHMLEGVEHHLRQLEQGEQVDLQAFWNVGSIAIPRAGYILDEHERNLLRTLGHETRPIIWQGLFIAWLESRHVVRDVVEAFRANLHQIITQFREQNIENPAGLRTLAAEARAVGFADLAQEIETTARWSETLQETVRRGPSLILQPGSSLL